MSLTWGNNASFLIEKPQGDSSLIIKDRSFEVEFIGIENPASIRVTENGKEKAFTSEYDNGILTVSAENVNDKLEITLENVAEFKPDNTKALFDILEHFENFPNRQKSVIENIIKAKKSTLQTINELVQLDIDKNALLSLVKILTACDYK